MNGRAGSTQGKGKGGGAGVDTGAKPLGRCRRGSRCCGGELVGGPRRRTGEFARADAQILGFCFVLLLFCCCFIYCNFIVITSCPQDNGPCPVGYFVDIPLFCKVIMICAQRLR